MEVLPAFSRPIAHRGLHDHANGVIENSATAFEHAVASGYAIECDIQLTGDDKGVVFHDHDLKRLVGQQGIVRQLSAGQITRIPLLGSASADTPQRIEALLEQVNGRTLLVIELKHQADPFATSALAKTVSAALKKYVGDVVVESFDPDLLIAMRKFGYAGHLGIVLTRHISAEDAPLNPLSSFMLRHMLHLPRTKFSFISCDKDALDLPMVRFHRSRGMPVTTWTIRSVEQAKAAAKHSDQIVFEGFLP